MALLSEVKYETDIKRFEDISSESVLSMLYDVRNSISRVDSSFSDTPLKELLGIIENGFYEVEGDISTKIDLSSAKGVINSYRRYSEGGCQCCINLGQEGIDAQDASSGYYCKISDPDYDKDTINSRPKVRYQGFSPKIKKYYNSPCNDNDWKPHFQKTLDFLLEEEQS